MLEGMPKVSRVTPRCYIVDLFEVREYLIVEDISSCQYCEENAMGRLQVGPERGIWQRLKIIPYNE